MLLQLFRQFRLSVLIETYWNVKVLILSLALAALVVLIETYWNVK